MKELTLASFPTDDGHIESILIGVGKVKVSFQTWNCRKLVLIYSDVVEVIERNIVSSDIGDYIIETLDNGVFKYIFRDAYYDEFENNSLLIIKASSVQIFEVGGNADINSALFDVGLNYI